MTQVALSVILKKIHDQLELGSKVNPDAYALVESRLLHYTKETLALKKENLNNLFVDFKISNIESIFLEEMLEPNSSFDYDHLK